MAFVVAFAVALTGSWASAGLAPIPFKKQRTNHAKIAERLWTNLLNDDAAATHLRAEVIWRFIRKSTAVKAGQFVLRLSVGIVTIGKQSRTKRQDYGADSRVWSFLTFSKLPSACNTFSILCVFRAILARQEFSE
jgi:hypothetical protein